jgi:serine/threonine protein kinase
MEILQVFLVRLTSTKKLYALKVINLTVLTKFQADRIQAEKDVMLKLRHPFIVRLKGPSVRVSES